MPPKNKTKSKVTEPEPDYDEEEEEDPEDDNITRCVCGSQDVEAGLMIQCETCEVWQHGICVGFTTADDAPERYYCEQCRPDQHAILHKSISRKPGQQHPASLYVMPPPHDGPPTHKLTASNLHAFAAAPPLSTSLSHSSSRFPSLPTKWSMPKRRNMLSSREAAYEEALERGDLATLEKINAGEDYDESALVKRKRKRSGGATAGDETSFGSATSEKLNVNDFDLLIKDMKSDIAPARRVGKRSRKKEKEPPLDAADANPLASPSQSGPPEDLGDEIIFHTVEPFDTRGHFCDLFLGDHRTVGKVALKRLRHRGGSEGDVETLTRQCIREKDVWMRLRHDRILKCLGTFTRERHLYLVSPFMKNGSLFDWLRSKPHIGLERLRLIHELANALVYLHSSGIVHGDIKSNNVLLSDDMHVQLCDFGLTKLAESATTTTLKGAGTVRWQSPELWTDTPKSFKSDSYAFAMTIVEILTGKIPFATIFNDYAVIMAVCMRGDRPVMEPEVSPDGKSYANAWDVAARCWHGDIDQRISMTEAVELFAFCTERY